MGGVTFRLTAVRRASRKRDPRQGETERESGLRGLSHFCYKNGPLSTPQRSTAGAANQHPVEPFPHPLALLQVFPEGHRKAPRTAKCVNLAAGCLNPERPACVEFDGGAVDTESNEHDGALH